MKRFPIVLLIILSIVFFIFSYNFFILKENYAVVEVAGSNSPDTKKITFIHWDYFPAEMFDRFNEVYPNILVDYRKLDEASYSLVQRTYISSGDQMDVMGIKENDYRDFVGKGYLVDLSSRSYLNNYRAEVRDEVKGLSPGKNREYGISYRSFVYGIWYNKILFNKYNIQVPECYQEFLEACRKLKENGVSPLILGARDDEVCSSIFLPRILKALEKDSEMFTRLNNGQLKWTDPAMMDLFLDIHGIIEKGYIADESLDLTYYQAFSEFAKGRSAMIMAPDSSININGLDLEQACEPGVFPIPYNDEGKPGKAAGSRICCLTGIFSESKSKEESDLLLKYLSSPEIAQIYSNITRSFSNVYEVNTGSLKYSELWEPLRKMDHLYYGVNQMDNELIRQYNRSAKNMLSKSRETGSILAELDDSVENSFK